MIKRYKRIGLALAVLAALLLSGTVFAEGGEAPEAGEPGDAPAAETAAQPEGTGGTEVLLEDAGQTGEPAGEPAETDEPVEVVGESEAPAEEPGETEIPAESADETEDLQEPAEDTGDGTTEVTVVDAGGQEVSLGTTASGGDPRWQVGKQWYSVTYTGGDCYPGTVLDTTCFAYDPSVSLVDMALGLMVNNGCFPGNGLLYVDAGEYLGFSLNQNHSGLKGIIGTDGSANTTINGNIEVVSNFGGFTLSGFTINGGLSLEQCNGNLVLSDLLVSNPNGHGVVIGKDLGDDDGYYVHFGNVTLTDVHSSGNNGAGARIYAYGNVKITASSFNNNNRFDMANDDPLDALDIITFGKNLDLNGVTANNNYGSGIVTWAGKTTIRNVIAKDNTIAGWEYPEVYPYKDYGFGLYLQAGSGSILVENAVADGNQNTGIKVNAWGKTPVTLRNISANLNWVDGVRVWSEGAVTVVNSLTDGNIEGDGLNITTAGAVRLTSIRASSNETGSGLVVEGREIWSFNKTTEEWTKIWTSPASVTLGSPKNIALTNHFADNGYAGIRIVSERSVTLSNFSALGNGVGVLVDGSRWVWDEGLVDWVYEDHPAGAVTIRPSIPGFTNQVSGNGTGITINSSSNVTLDRLQILNNTANGLVINTSGNARVTNLDASGNGGHGVFIDAGGSTTLSNIRAVGNAENNGVGVSINAVGNVTLGGSNTITDNESSGLQIFTQGVVKVSNLDASRNSGTGVDIAGSGIGRAVTLSNVNASGNGAAGIRIEADGNVALSGSNMVNSNGEQGLTIVTSGSVNVMNTQANLNGHSDSGSGIRIQSFGEKASVTLRNVTAYGNSSQGMDVSAFGRISLSGVNAWLNSGNGARLESTSGGIAILNSTFMCNGGYGVLYQGTLLQDSKNIFLANVDGGLAQDTA
jgi:hypothetical protein